MDNYNIITPSSKFKHLSFEHYEYIIREITKHDAFHHGKKRNTGRTALIRSLASDVGTSVSNVYSIIKDASISILDSDLITHKELSASAAFHKRTKLRYADIERKPGSKEKRTSVYFGRPYHSCDRASNENCNGLIRRFIKKGTDINTIDIAVSRSINRQINNKKRKILGYISAEQSYFMK